jgi:nucleoside-diphosphate-sugar epimerase
MKILVTGGAGFLGTQLGRALLRNAQASGSPLELLLADLALPMEDLHNDPRVRVLVGPIVEHCATLAKEACDLVFHLAGAVSAECEANFELGLRSNLDTTRALLDAMRSAGNRPRFIFASSVAVYGSDPGLPLPSLIHDHTLPTPQSSYGIQKFICEQLVTDYTRKGFIDGRIGRLMTVVVRPGQPNGAASGFLSAIVREPLNDMDAICPVPLEMPVALASPRNTVRSLITLAEAESEALAGRTAINFPALTVTVGGILEALEAVAGRAVRSRVKFRTDPAITSIVGGWPSVFHSERALRLGLQPDSDMISIIEQFISEHGAIRTGA